MYQISWDHEKNSTITTFATGYAPQLLMNDIMYVKLHGIGAAYRSSRFNGRWWYLVLNKKVTATFRVLFQISLNLSLAFKNRNVSDLEGIEWKWTALYTHLYMCI